MAKKTRQLTKKSSDLIDKALGEKNIQMMISRKFCLDPELDRGWERTMDKIVVNVEQSGRQVKNMKQARSITIKSINKLSKNTRCK